MTEPERQFRFVLGVEHKKERIDRALVALLRGVSRSTAQRWIAEDRVLVNGTPCRPSDTVGPGSIIEVQPGAPPPSRVEPDPTVPFEVLFEDESLLVVEKPAGVVVHPGRGNWEHTLVAGLLARPGFERAPFDDRDPIGPLRPGIVHRIDKDTSGILVVAKSEPARESLKEQLSAHSVERQYVALTVGVPAPGRIETLHGRHPTSRLRFTTHTTDGKPAITVVTVEQRLANGRAALVSCRLETGRTHQIRVHLAEVRRTPILADALYGGQPKVPDLAGVAQRLGRQALHAKVLGFTHPVSGERLRFESDLPPDFSRALAELEKLA